MNKVGQLLPARPEEEQFEVLIEVRSIKHDCHVAYRLNEHEIENGYAEQIIRDLKYRMLDFIQEKQNATSEGKSSQDEERVLN